MIEIQHLTKNYGDFVAVNDISLTARDGEIFGFLGPNGAGKTTTIRVLAGLTLPTRGKVLLNGIDVVAEPLKAKAITGYIPDRPFLYEKLTGIETIRFFADLYSKRWGDCQGKVAELLDFFGLTPWAHSRVENYSHGMKQKLVIIASMVHDPAVLVIDEPMVGLDALAQKLVRQLLKQQVELGKTIFLTTHTLSVAEAVCDRVAILSRGRIVAAGTPSELKAEAHAGALEDVFLELTEAEPQSGP